MQARAEYVRCEDHLTPRPDLQQVQQAPVRHEASIEEAVGARCSAQGKAQHAPPVLARPVEVPHACEAERREETLGVGGGVEGAGRVEAVEGCSKRREALIL